MTNYAKVLKRDVAHYLMMERDKDYKKRDKLSDELIEILACYDEEKAKELLADEQVFGRIYYKALDALNDQTLTEDHHARLLAIIGMDHDLGVEIRLFDRLINYVDRMKGLRE